MKKIVLTGGGTAGHVTPNIALIPELQKEGYEVSYIGSHDGMERKLIECLGIDYVGISSGKLRRYFSLRNFTDPFRVIKGFGEAVSALKRIKPNVIFSKGGFVTVPVVFAAKRLGIPVIIHESDISPGLANKLCIPASKFVCANFPEALNYLPKEKAVLTGTPIRKELFLGNREKGLEFCGFSGNKPVLLVIGGSLGALAVNKVLRKILPELNGKFDVIHICGKGKTEEELNGTEGYVQFEYVGSELRDIFAASDIALSRAGANAICELLALRLPNLLIPLPAASSRGDQILNAESFKKQGFSEVLMEENLTEVTMLKNINDLYNNREKYIEKMKQSSQADSIKLITELIKRAES